MRIPLSSPDITDAEIEAVSAVLRSRMLSLGAKLQEFEAACARRAGCAHAVAVNSGTSGLHLCVRALDLKAGDEVVAASFSFVASTNVLLMENLRPRFIEINPQTYNIDVDQIEAAITSRTKALMIVHTFGRPAPMQEILDIARRRNLLVIEDACEAIGASIEIEGREIPVGALGALGAFAFYPNKQITTGEGGGVVTHDERLARRIRAMRNQGRYESADWFEHEELGYNYRLSEINCALGEVQLERLDEILVAREQVTHAYAERLESNSSLYLPPLNEPNARISWFVYVVRLSDDYGIEDRDRIAREMRERGIGCGRYFAPIHLQPFYRRQFGYKDGDLPVTESVAARTLALPFFNRITGAELDEVCYTLQELMR